jgi:hypothetical protein
MTYSTLITQSELIVITTFAGLALGTLYFAALKRSVTLFVGHKGWLGALTLALGRIGAAVGFLLIGAKLGAAPLLSGFAGFLMALALRAERRAG